MDNSKDSSGTDETTRKLLADRKFLADILVPDLKTAAYQINQEVVDYLRDNIVSVFSLDNFQKTPKEIVHLLAEADFLLETESCVFYAHSSKKTMITAQRQEEKMKQRTISIIRSTLSLENYYLFDADNKSVREGYEKVCQQFENELRTKTT